MIISIRNPDDEFVSNLKDRIKDNNGYCLYAENRNSKQSKCTKWCKKDASKCMCGMYIQSDDSLQGEEYDLD